MELSAERRNLLETFSDAPIGVGLNGTGKRLTPRKDCLAPTLRILPGFPEPNEFTRGFPNIPDQVRGQSRVDLGGHCGNQAVRQAAEAFFISEVIESWGPTAENSLVRSSGIAAAILSQPAFQWPPCGSPMKRRMESELSFQR